MSAFLYNNVRLSYVRTLRFSVADEKDPSGTDQLWRVYTISVRGVVSSSSPPTNGPQTLNAYKEALTTPRCAVFYQMGSEVILNTAGMDARYGPDAPEVEVNQVVEGVVFATVTLKVRVAACANNPRATEIASLRWSQAEEVDGGEWLTTIVTRGLLVARTDLRRLNADSFREALPVPVPGQFFTRTSVYTLDETGTRLSFEFRDRENYTMPPNLAVEANGTFAVTSNKGGAMRYAAVNLTLKGPPNVPRGMLMAQAFAVAWAKIQGAKPQQDRGRIIVDYVATEDMYRNVVQVSMRATLQALSLDMLGSANSALYGDTPGSANTRSIAPPLRRRVAGLLAAAFRDPCASASAQLDSQYRSLTSDPTRYPPASISTGSVPSALPDGPSPAYKKDYGGYDVYRVESTYDWDEGKAALPGTGVGAHPKRAKVAQVHGGLMYLYIDWAVKRRGKPPVYPAYLTGDPNLEPLRAVYRPLQQDVSADQTPVWDVSGRYVYLVIDPDKIAMAAARPPYLSELAGQQAATQTLKNAADRVFGGVAAAAAGGGDTPPPAGGGGGANGSGPNPVTGSGVTTGQEPTPDLANQLTAAQRAYIDQVVALGGNRAAVTADVLNGLSGPLGGVGPAVNP